MTVHMFRCYIGRDQSQYTVAELESTFNDWVAANGEWTGDAVEHTLTERNTAMDGSGDTYYGGDVRFLPENAKDTLLQKLTDKLENKTLWYRVGYHACTHRPDDGSSGACSWDDAVEWTAKDESIPGAVPSFEVTTA